MIIAHKGVCIPGIMKFKNYFLFFCLMATNVLLGGNAEEIELVVRDNLRAMATEDVEAVLATVHPESLTYAQTEQVLQTMFERYDLEYTLIAYRYISEDGGYAMARVVQRTQKIEGPEFRDNDIDLIQIFKKDGTEWKLWSQAILNIAGLSPAGAG